MRFPAVIALLCAGLAACSSSGPVNVVDPAAAQAAKAAATNCASPKIIAVIRDKIFDAAIEQAKSGTQNLNNLRSAVVGRIESPLLQSFDQTLQRSQCSGRVIFPLPPSVQKAFGENDSLSAEIAYSVQPAADKSGLVVEATGVEPVIQMLVDASQKKRIVKVVVPYPGAQNPSSLVIPPPPRIAPPGDVLSEPSRPSRMGNPGPFDPPASASAANPSFSCKGSLSRVERLICDDALLAVQDRTMATAYRAAKRRAAPDQVSRLESTNSKYRAQRNACNDAACIAGTYDVWTLTLENWNGENPE